VQDVARWLAADELWAARWLFVRGLGVVYAIAFVVTLDQFRPLLGERGLLPVPVLLRRRSFRQAPSLFHLGYSDRWLVVAATAGLAGSLAVVVGLPERGPVWVPVVVWFLLWALYLSIVNVGQTFYAFGWESLLLEAGFLAAFLGPDGHAPPVVVVWALWWLLFRVEWGAGLIKLRGDPCWRDLTCLQYHHETQPLPNPLSRRFHHLPRWTHRVEVAANHVTQLAVPFLLLAPQPVRGWGAAAMVVTQGWLMLSGNFAWLNLVTALLAATALWPSLLEGVVPDPPAALAPLPDPMVVLVLAVGGSMAVLGWWPLRNMLSPGQRMNASFNSLHLGNTYGAFGSITRVRREVVVEGTEDDDPYAAAARWLAYGFRAKPGDLARRPPQVAPYHLRLDWLMWFLALDPRYGAQWFDRFLDRLLVADPATLRLLRHDPFAGRRPTAVRAVLHEYRFTTRAERRATGNWWSRREIGVLVGPLAPRAPAQEPRR
jgi:hypothetical protein